MNSDVSVGGPYILKLLKVCQSVCPGAFSCRVMELLTSTIYFDNHVSWSLCLKMMPSIRHMTHMLPNFMLHVRIAVGSAGVYLTSFSTTVIRGPYLLTPWCRVLLEKLTLFAQHTDYYKVVKQLKSFKIVILAPTCFSLQNPTSGISQPVLR